MQQRRWSSSFVRGSVVLWLVLVAALLAGCASGPRAPAGGGVPRVGPLFPDRDGPGDNPPPDLAQVPDAQPRVEPVRPGGPNKPYELMGRQYVPLGGDPPFTEKGLASWYGRKFHGRPTASGETYNMYAMTAAHPTLPIPSYVRVRNPANGRSVIVRVNDRGPFHSNRIIDLSYTAALKLDLLRGVRPVEIERITYEDIRTGAWRREGDTMLASTVASKGGDAAQADAPSAVMATSTAAADAATANAITPTAVASAAPGTAVRSSTPAPTAPPAQAIAAAMPASPAASNTDSGASTGAPATASTPTAPADAPQLAAPVASTAPPIADTAAAGTPAARGFWVQLGAFRDASGAVDFQRKVERELDSLTPLLAIFKDRSLHRLQAGPYRTRADAASAADRIRTTLQLVPVIVERR